ncbi:hypothetical protein M422DRAFT_266220 [Sphaerobolus stellatus SS14]|uniref:Uncharacterized protein n=1 Tax=Sphaerobolus stellatus (strain SS14) TaxID=990650 RepID=A0A0C9UBI9_SPHS4|nr:hypothetical protein M422DRAFT_266220 [Sphaerobolus stellatus SS14]
MSLWPPFVRHPGASLHTHYLPLRMMLMLMTELASRTALHYWRSSRMNPGACRGMKGLSQQYPSMASEEIEAWEDAILGELLHDASFQYSTPIPDPPATLWLTPLHDPPPPLLPALVIQCQVLPENVEEDVVIHPLLHWPNPAGMEYLCAHIYNMPIPSRHRPITEGEDPIQANLVM